MAKKRNFEPDLRELKSVSKEPDNGELESEKTRLEKEIQRLRDQKASLEEEIEKLGEEADEEQEEDEKESPTLPNLSHLYDFGAAPFSAKSTDSPVDPKRIGELMNRVTEEKVDVYKKDVKVSILYRKKGDNPISFEESIVVESNGIDKNIYTATRPSGGIDTEDIIKNIRLSPNKKRIAFDAMRSGFGSINYQGIIDKKERSIYVMNINGNKSHEINYGRLSFKLPKNKADEEEEKERKAKEKDILYLLRHPNEREKNDFYSGPPKAYLYQPRWIGNDILEFKGYLMYQKKLLDNMPPFSTKGPKCLIHVKIGRNNEIEDSELVKVLEEK